MTRFGKNMGISLADVEEMVFVWGKVGLLGGDVLLLGELLRGSHFFVFKYINGILKIRF